MSRNNRTNPAPGFARHPAHRVDIEPAGRRLTARFNGAVIADSRTALVVRETGYPPVVYFPAADVHMARLSPSAHKTYCPFKGEASYWHLAAGGRVSENAAWSYPAPYDECLELADHVAFHADRLDPPPLLDSAASGE